MANKRDRVKERFWRDALARQATSGLSVRSFCRHQRLSEASFYAWRRTIARRDGQANLAIRWKRPAFVPLTLGERPRREASFTIELAGGRVLRLPEAVPAERLAEIVRALEAGAGP
jgi:hypothetical protein